MDEQKRSGIGGIGDGIRTGIGILSALKEAVQETLQEAVDRGDLSADRAKRTMQDAAQRIQTTFEDARERMEFVPRREFDQLREDLGSLRDRVARLEGPTEAPPPEEPSIIMTE